MATQGTAVLNFGAFPGTSDASVAITGQAGIAAGSLAEAWVSLSSTADHSADEHLVETLAVKAGNIAPGVGFTIYGVNTNNISEPDRSQSRLSGLREPRLYGLFNINWVWN